MKNETAELETTTINALAPADLEALARKHLAAFVGPLSDLAAAARDYVAALAAVPELNTIMLRLAPEYHLPRSFLVRFELIGKGAMHPQLLLDPCRLLMRVGLDDQRRLIESGVEVAVDPKNDSEHRLLRWADMSTVQRQQVVGDGCVRDVPAQVVYLRNTAPPPAPVFDKNQLPYYWSKGRIHFRAGADFSIAELMRIAAEGAS